VPRKATLSLTPENYLCLQNIVDHGADWRERERSKNLILIDDGLSMRKVSEIIDIDIKAVGLTRMDLLKRCFESSVDAPLSGAPKMITDEQLRKILEAGRQEPLTANFTGQTHRQRRRISTCEHEKQGIEENRICMETHTIIAQKR
jgi:transposase